MAFSNFCILNWYKKNIYNSQRKQIVTGEYEPSAEECDVPIIFGLPAEVQKVIYIFNVCTFSHSSE